MLTTILLLFASAMISGAEVAFFSLSPTNKSSLEESKSKKAAIVLKLLHKPDYLLSTILILNNFVNIAIVMISAFLTQSLFDFSFINPFFKILIQVGIITFFLILFGEVLPKIYANRFAMKFSLAMARPLFYLSHVVKPLSKLLIKSTSIVNKRMIKKNNISIDDISDAIDLTSDTKKDEEELLKRIVRFGDIDVKEIMKARIDIVAIDIKSKLNDIKPIIVNEGYSRIPVFMETFDNIKGVLYIKDLLPHLDKSNSFNWQTLIRPSYFVPETKKIVDLLDEFQTNKIHMAVVIDEYGGTLGIVTLEDILEEIIGEIVDEDDDDEITFTKVNDNTYQFEAKTLINDFCKIFEIEDDVFDDAKGETETLAGLILELKGEIPKKNDEIIFKQFTFKVMAVDKRRIKKVEVKIKK